MKTLRDPDARLKAYLADGMNALPDRVADAVLTEIHGTSQRVVIGPWRSPLMTGPFKLAAATLAAGIAVSVLAFNALPRDAGTVGGPAAPSPTPLATPSLEPGPSQQSDRMTVAGSNTGVAIQLPDTWQNGEYVASAASEDPAAAAAFFLTRVSNTYVDPCAGIERDPPIDSTVEAAAAALSEIPGTTATAPVQTTIGTYDATYLELTIPSSLPCAPEQFSLIQESPGGEAAWWPLAHNEVILFWIVDVGGEPIAIAGRTFAETSDAARAELENIIDTIAFDEPPTQPSASPATSP